MASVAIVSGERVVPLRRLLGKAGYQTIVAVDARQLLELHAVAPVQVVLLHPSLLSEGSLPDMVRTVARGLGDDGIAIMPMLQRSNLADRVRSLWYGAANIVNLPLRNDELLAGIASVLGREPSGRSSRTMSATA